MCFQYMAISFNRKRKRSFTKSRVTRKKVKLIPKKKFGQKKFKRSKIGRGKPMKTGTGHWLTTTHTGKIGKISKWTAGLTKGQLPYHYTVNQAGYITSAVGSQRASPTTAAAVLTHLSMWSPADIYVMSSAVTNGNVQRLMLNNCSMKIFGTNQSNGVQFIELYEIVNRRDCTPANTEVATPYAAWTNNSLLETASNWTVIGSTPYLQRAFTTMYKVLKVTRYNLNPGETFEHIWRDKPMKRWDTVVTTEQNADAASPTVGQGGYRGLTKHVMIVQWSAPYNDSTTKTEVSTGAGTVDYVISKQYSVTPIYSSVTAFTSTNNLPQTFTVAQDIMNDDSGAAVALVNA